MVLRSIMVLGVMPVQLVCVLQQALGHQPCLAATNRTAGSMPPLYTGPAHTLHTLHLISVVSATCSLAVLEPPAAALPMAAALARGLVGDEGVPCAVDTAPAASALVPVGLGAVCDRDQQMRLGCMSRPCSRAAEAVAVAAVTLRAVSDVVGDVGVGVAAAAAPAAGRACGASMSGSCVC
jgi:hypothetical protein